MKAQGAATKRYRAYREARQRSVGDEAWREISSSRTHLRGPVPSQETSRTMLCAIRSTESERWGWLRIETPARIPRHVAIPRTALRLAEATDTVAARRRHTIHRAGRRRLRWTAAYPISAHRRARAIGRTRRRGLPAIARPVPAERRRRAVFWTVGQRLRTAAHPISADRVIRRLEAVVLLHAIDPIAPFRPYRLRRTARQPQRETPRHRKPPPLAKREMFDALHHVTPLSASCSTTSPRRRRAPRYLPRRSFWPRPH